jgi:hypothetical protein
MRYVATASKRDLAQHTQAEHTLVAFPLEPGYLEFRMHRVDEQDRLAEPAALLEKGDHRGLEALRERGGAERRHRHDEEPVGNAGAEARLARVVFVVVDGVVVAREPREEEEVGLAQRGAGAPESAAEREIVEVESWLSPSIAPLS